MGRWENGIPAGCNPAVFGHWWFKSITAHHRLFCRLQSGWRSLFNESYHTQLECNQLSVTVVVSKDLSGLGSNPGGGGHYYPRLIYHPGLKPGARAKLLSSTKQLSTCASVSEAKTKEHETFVLA